MQCPECGNECEGVFSRMDWRKASRPERTRIEHPVGYSVMCWACWNRIQAEYSPGAPTFDRKGNRIYQQALAIA